MRTYTCLCGNTLYFDNTACTACGRAAGWCEPCAAVCGLDPVEGSSPMQYVCSAGHVLSACDNHVRFDVCNRYRVQGPGLCETCVLNRTVPDQSVAGNRARWARLEAAKRRMVYDLDLIGCGLGRLLSSGSAPPLQFDFMADNNMTGGHWRPMNDGEPVFTGHDNGVITLNLKETDSVEREKTRVNLGEPQRTLVGHFRHEIGHYVYDVLIRGNPDRMSRFIACFGDPDAVTYAQALERHYEQGPPADWQQHYVSSYATMHPWEDWAETWHAYLHIAGTLDTLHAHGLCQVPRAFEDFDRTLQTVVEITVALNEIAKDSGLVQLMPHNLSQPVVAKLRCLTELLADAHRS